MINLCGFKALNLVVCCSSNGKLMSGLYIRENQLCLRMWRTVLLAHISAEETQFDLLVGERHPGTRKVTVTVAQGIKLMRQWTGAGDPGRAREKVPTGQAGVGKPEKGNVAEKSHKDPVLGFGSKEHFKEEAVNRLLRALREVTGVN